MKQLIAFLFAILVFSACNQRTGSGNIVTDRRRTADFHGISVGGAFTVEVKIGSPTEVTVEADDNVIALIETKVDDGILKIRTKNGSSFNDAHFKVFVTVPELSSINSSGAANVKVLGPLKSNEKISLDASGAAGITASLDAPEIEAEITGAANMELSGRTRDYSAEVSGSGELKSGGLRSENTDVHVSGAGNAHVHASVSLKADASGAGNIYYKGGGNTVVKTSGAGNVKNEN
jgi:hypothetical protein